jgi:hypothetical protein
MSKRSPEDILKDIEESDLEEAADKALAMTEVERHAALKVAGVDLGELHAKADALHERMRRAATEQGIQELEAEARQRALASPPSRRGAVLRLGAVAAAAIVVALLVRARRQGEPPTIAAPSAMLPPSAIPAAPTPAPSLAPTPAPSLAPTPTPDAAPPPSDKPHLK